MKETKTITLTNKEAIQLYTSLKLLSLSIKDDETNLKKVLSNLMTKILN